MRGITPGPEPVPPRQRGREKGCNTSPGKLVGPGEALPGPWRIQGEILGMVPGEGKLRSGTTLRKKEGSVFRMDREEANRQTDRHRRS